MFDKNTILTFYKTVLFIKFYCFFFNVSHISPDPNEKWNTEVTADPGFHRLEEPSLLLQR